MSDQRSLGQKTLFQPLQVTSEVKVTWVKVRGRVGQDQRLTLKAKADWQIGSCQCQDLI